MLQNFLKWNNSLSIFFKLSIIIDVNCWSANSIEPGQAAHEKNAIHFWSQHAR